MTLLARRSVGVWECWRLAACAAVALTAGAAAAEPAADRGAIVSLPMDPAAINARWEFVDAEAYRVGVVKDEILGRDVLEVVRDAGKKLPKIKSSILRSRTPVGPGCVVEALVRFPQPPVDAKGAPKPAPVTKVTLACGRTSAADATAACVLEAGSGEKQFSYAGRCGAQSIAGRNALTPFLTVADVSPFAHETFRLETEAGLAANPVPHETWIPLRIEMGAERARMYVRGMLVAEGPTAGSVPGPVELSFLQHDVRVALLEARPSGVAAERFVRVPLDFPANAAGPVDVPAMTANREAFAAHGIPFLLSAGVGGKDHVDVGASVFRHRLGTRYAADIDPRVHVQPPTIFEPGRIRLHVPQRAYARAWVLAAATDDPRRAPILTLRFYRPQTDWSVDAATTVPAFTATSGGATARPVPVKTKQGGTTTLWLVPIDLDTAAITGQFRQPLLSIEVTKEVKPSIAYPDPANYSYQPGGPPSSVQLYGLTLEEAPLRAVAACDVKGGVYVSPERPTWEVSLDNQRTVKVEATVRLDVTDPDGRKVPLEKRIALEPGARQTATFPIAATMFTPARLGLHTVRTTVAAADWKQSREGTFLVVPPIDRRATGKDSPWGLWTWHGTHDTLADSDENARLLHAVGAINQFPLDRIVDRRKNIVENLDPVRAKWGLGPSHHRLVPRDVPPWAKAQPIDPAARDAWRDEKGQEAKKLVAEHPDFRYVNCFAENAVSLRLTHGIPPWALGQPWFEYDEQERTRLTQLLTTANAAAEAVQRDAPGVKFLFGHCAPNFFGPFFREKDWNPDLFAGFGLDMPQFERMPERQPRATEPSLLFFLRKEMKDRGLEGKELVHLESYYPSSHELALGSRGQADSIVRTAVLSLALGTTKFMHAWCLQDCADRWGSSHYSGCGLIGREPEGFPKPAAAAFATMTRVLDLARYSGWLETGSRTAFCLRFDDGDRRIYPVWTCRGTRPLEISVAAPDVRLEQIDEHGNAAPLPLADGKASVELTPTVRWLVARGGEIKGVRVGPPMHAEAPIAAERRIVLEDFEKSPWTYEAGPLPLFADNSWDMVREPVRMTQELVASPERKSTVWRIGMADRPTGKPCVGFYGVFRPARPIPIPGKAETLVLQGRGGSQWGRFVYELVDAGGERWISCGQKNTWNSDDIHSWSSFNHDGWRPMRFPLPSTAPGDHFREKGCYSWGSTGDGIVDLPLSLTGVIVEMRTDIIYVDQLLPVEDASIEIDDIVAVYDDPRNMTDAPAKLHAATRDAWRPTIAASTLPNPIKALAEAGAGPPPQVEKVYPPEVMDSGDQVYVKIRPVESAAKYTVYVSATPDGTGGRAAPAKVGADPSLLLVRELQPAIPMYFFVSSTDKEGRESRPSEARKIVLRDEFPFK
jgi:hypothetical protein